MLSESLGLEPEFDEGDGCEFRQAAEWVREANAMLSRSPPGWTVGKLERDTWLVFKQR